MTISAEARTKNAERLLRQCVEVIEGRGVSFREQFFEPGEALASDLLPLTWLDLLARGFVQVDTSRPFHRLTGAGWLEGLKLTGRCDDATERARLLVRELRRVVDPRPDDGPEGIDDVEAIAYRAGLSAVWVLNALESNLLAHVFGSRNYNVRLDYPVVYVPANFGHEPLAW